VQTPCVPNRRSQRGNLPYTGTGLYGAYVRGLVRGLYGDWGCIRGDIRGHTGTGDIRGLGMVRAPRYCSAFAEENPGGEGGLARGSQGRPAGQGQRRRGARRRPGRASRTDARLWSRAGGPALVACTRPQMRTCLTFTQPLDNGVLSLQCLVTSSGKAAERQPTGTA